MAFLGELARTQTRIRDECEAPPQGIHMWGPSTPLRAYLTPLLLVLSETGEGTAARRLAGE